MDDSGKEMVTLYEEIETLKLYLNLEQSRMPGQLDYELRLDEELDKYHLLVPPLILQPIVENAIWHGIVPNGTGKVSISVTEAKDYKGGDYLVCEVVDDGIGVTEIKKLKRSLYALDGDSTLAHASKGMLLTAARSGMRDALKDEQLSEGGT